MTANHIINRASKSKQNFLKVRNLKYLAPFSTIANLITMVSFGIICYYMFRESISFEAREPVGELRHFPLFFGTVLFALEAIGVVSNNRRPRMRSSLNQC